MKHLFILLFACTIISKLSAQTLEEWTQQKQTQKKYLIEQIAALKVYNDYVQKGFNLVQEGLSLIHTIKSGDFTLHQNYFQSLGFVNPKIKDFSRIADIITLQVTILNEYKKTCKQLKENKGLHKEELNYYYQVGTQLIEGCMEVVNDVIKVITDGDAQMKDDERLERIDSLYNELQEKFVFLKSFDNKVKVLAFQRVREEGTNRVVQSLYDQK